MYSVLLMHVLNKQLVFTVTYLLLSNKMKFQVKTANIFISLKIKLKD